MLMKNCMATPTTAAHRKARPATDAMYGKRMYSPLATPTPTRITLGPISLRSLAGSGSSRSMTSAGAAPPGFLGCVVVCVGVVAMSACSPLRRLGDQFVDVVQHPVAVRPRTGEQLQRS